MRSLTLRERTTFRAIGLGLVLALGPAAAGLAEAAATICSVTLHSNDEIETLREAVLTSAEATDPAPRFVELTELAGMSQDPPGDPEAVGAPDHGEQHAAEQARRPDHDVGPRRQPETEPAIDEEQADPGPARDREAASAADDRPLEEAAPGGPAERPRPRVRPSRRSRATGAWP